VICWVTAKNIYKLKGRRGGLQNTNAVRSRGMRSRDFMGYGKGNEGEDVQGYESWGSRSRSASFASFCY
jgi:hypothetical protein